MYTIALIILIAALIIYCKSKLHKKKGCYNNECKTNIKNTLIYTANKLNKFNIRWWVDFGTLLGMFRGDGIIHGDDDADFSYDARDTDKLFAMFEEIKAENRYIITNDGWCREPYKIKDGQNGAVVDLFPFYIHEQRMLSAHSPADDCDVDTIYPLRWIYSEKLHVAVPAPNNIRKRLIDKYGDDFMIPQNKKGNDSEFIRVGKVMGRCLPRRFNREHVYYRPTIS